MDYEVRKAGGLCSWQRERFLRYIPGSWSDHVAVSDRSFGLETNKPQLKILTEFPISQKLFSIQTTPFDLCFGRSKGYKRMSPD
jgi:hypothetical protein